MSERTKIYFASDFHLGAPDFAKSRARELKIIKWLDEIKIDAKSIYLVGDIFDFWFEYKKVVPKGFVRLLGKLAELTDSGIEIHLSVGNHDMWMKDYLSEEVGIQIHFDNHILTTGNTKIFIGHGDGYGNGDYTYKILKKVFRSQTCHWLFSRIHPNLALSLAHHWSLKSRAKGDDSGFISNEKEILVDYCKQQQKITPVDYYIFGHRHLPLEIQIDKQSKYINLGDWLQHYTYAVFSNGAIALKTY